MISQIANFTWLMFWVAIWAGVVCIVVPALLRIVDEPYGEMDDADAADPEGDTTTRFLDPYEDRGDRK